MMYLVNGGKYSAELKLGFLEKFVSNNVIKEKLEAVGFIDVVVIGDNKERKAIGTYTGDSMDVELPPQVTKIFKL